MSGLGSGSVAAGRPERRAALVRELLALSERMLVEAEASRWEAVMERERQRQRVAWELFVAPLGGEERHRWQPELDRVLAISRRLTDIARTERESVAKALLKARQGREGQRAYAQWARS